MSDRALFEINPELDRDALAQAFERDGRVQVRDVLTVPAAQAIREVLGRSTPWGLAYQAGDGEGPKGVAAQELAGMGPAGRQQVATRVANAVAAGEYGFAYAQYRMLDAYLGRWAPGGPHDLLLEHLNSAPFLDLVRAIARMPELIKAEAQATLYAAGHFLARHNDSHVAAGRKLAYVLNLGLDDWKPDWGGYLLFFDADGDVVQGYRPRFNSLNIFAVPQDHSVSYVPPFAPVGRFAITGWVSDR